MVIIILAGLTGLLFILGALLSLVRRPSGSSLAGYVHTHTRDIDGTETREQVRIQ